MVLKISKGSLIKALKQEGITGVVMLTTNPYFDSMTISGATYEAEMLIRICSLHYHPSNPFLFQGFLQQSLFSF